MLIHGRCHCGNIAFDFRWETDPVNIPARACTCSFCTRHAAVWTSHPEGDLKISVGDSSLLMRYAFGTRTAEFHICARCGVVPLVTSCIDGKIYAVVNVNSFEGVEPSLFLHSLASLDGEGEEARLARRKRHWIASVAYIGSEP